MKKTLFSSVVISGIVALSSAAFASTPITATAKATKTPVKVESKMTNNKKIAVKPVLKMEKKTVHAAERSNEKVASSSAKKH